MWKKYLKAKLEIIFLIKISDQNSSVFPFVSCVVSWSKRFTRNRISVPMFSLYTLYIPFQGRVLGHREGVDLGRSGDGKQP